MTTNWAFQICERCNEHLCSPGEFLCDRCDYETELELAAVLSKGTP